MREQKRPRESQRIFGVRPEAIVHRSRSSQKAGIPITAQCEVAIGNVRSTSTPAGRNAPTAVIRRRLGEHAKSTLSCHSAALRRWRLLVQQRTYEKLVGTER